MSSLIRRRFSESRSSLTPPGRSGRDVNSLDYEYAEGSGRFNPEAIASVVRRQVKIRERLGVFRHVIAMHELEATTAALAIIVPELRSRGYEFVRLSEFFGFAEKLKAAEKGE